jgi:multiple sugar transport system permease protein
MSGFSAELLAPKQHLKRSSFWKRNQRTLAPWIFLGPGIILFAIYIVIPIFQSIALSFYEYDGIVDATWIGLANYQELFADRAFYISLNNNVIWFVLYLLAIPAGLGIALLLNQNIFGIRLYKTLVFFPFVISHVVVGLMFAWFYAPDVGILVHVFAFFGLPETVVLADERFVTYGIVVAGLWLQIAFCMILYLTGLSGLAPEQIEAARLDGAKGWRMLWHVVLPQLRAATFLSVVVTIISSLRSFDLVSIMTEGGPFGSSRVLSYYMYEMALSEYGYRMGYGAAIAVVLFAIMLVFIVIFIWRMAQDER